MKMECIRVCVAAHYMEVIRSNFMSNIRSFLSRFRAFSSTRTVLGIDLNTTHLSLVKLSFKNAKPTILASKVHIFTEESSFENALPFIQTLTLEPQFQAQTVVISIPDHWLLSQCLQIPDGLSVKEIEDTIWAESLHILPYPLEDLYVDFYRISLSHTLPDSVDFAVVAVLSERLLAHLALLAPVKASIRVVDVASYAKTRAMEHAFHHEMPESLWVALGLALHPIDPSMGAINLLPWREWRQKKLRQQGIWRLGGGIFCVFFVLLILNQFYLSEIKNKQMMNQTLEAQVHALEAKIQALQTIQVSENHAEKQQAILFALQSGKKAMVRALDALVNLLPDQVYIMQISQRFQQVTILGHSESDEGVVLLLRRLQSSPLFSDPLLMKIRKSTTSIASRTNQFKLKFLLK